MKTALVTGASSGLGASIAAELALRGYTVVGTSRHGGTFAQLELRDAASVARCVAGLQRLDLLVNNA
ncbi:MAG TPA: SDR family NAD(P)-dependent oxidoreductase, partial [Polyangiales bacterium]